MTGRTFVDTNVLVYAVDRADPVKRSKADAALAALRGEFVLSAQVLGEFYVTITRKLAVPVDPVDAAERVARLSPRRTVALDAALVRAAIETSRQSQLSYWDALIVEAAVAGGCSTILTEDLAAGSVIRGVESSTRSPDHRWLPDGDLSRVSMGAQAPVLRDERPTPLDRRRVDQPIGRVTWEACRKLDGGRRDRRRHVDRSDPVGEPAEPAAQWRGDDIRVVERPAAVRLTRSGSADR